MTTTPDPTTTTSESATRPVALVTGANKGLGLETVARLAALGWTVHLGARDPERLEKAVAEVQGRVDGADVRALPLDVTDDASVAAAVEVVRAASGHLDVLVNNAGVAGTSAAPGDVVAADFLPVYGVNVLGPVRMTAAFLPLLRAAAAPRSSWCRAGSARSPRPATPSGSSRRCRRSSTPRRRRRST